ncbi:MAG: DUF928 domain-containing protein [Nitrospirae bacterium]|nr:DUF928 domain-containing protein [Nitrospirota bacterium]
MAEVLLKSPTHPGFWPIRLGDYQIALEEDVWYRWYVSVVRDPDRHQPDIVAGGSIKRVDPRLVDYYGRTCDRDSVLLAQKARVWIDAFACVNELIEANPKDRDLYDLRDRILRHVQVFPGLELPVPRCDSLEPNSPNNSGLCLLNAKP